MRHPLHHLIVLVSLLGILLSAQGGLLVHGLFQLRHEYIAAHLCENRHDPTSDCDGKCFLKKRLAQSEDHSHEHTAPTPAASPILFFLPAVSTTTLLRGPEQTQAYPTRDERSDRDGHPRDIDPPPRSA
jgi:hypothetical protein